MTGFLHIFQAVECPVTARLKETWGNRLCVAARQRPTLAARYRPKAEVAFTEKRTLKNI
ncbi:MAG: hypothetical protein JSR83_01190 [Proteobacteria bacterium]|nr:hypothetical protein [Pseudomonadota bacterium]